MDFGIGIEYLTREEPRVHIPEEKRSQYIGTLHFSSMKAHEMMNSSRRDDLESLGYSILFLLTNNGHYSWMEYETSAKDNMREVHSKFYQAKYQFVNHEVNPRLEAIQ